MSPGNLGLWLVIMTGASSNPPLDVMVVYLDDVSPDMFTPWILDQEKETIDLPYGMPRDGTPTLGKLAREGVAFRTALAPAMCVPSRMTLLTGRYAYYHGVWHNFLRLRDATAQITTLPGQLRVNGYWTSAVGKWGCPLGIPASFDDFFLWTQGPAPRPHCKGGEDIHGEKSSRYWQPCYRRRDGSYPETLPHHFGPDLEVDWITQVWLQNDDHRSLSTNSSSRVGRLEPPQKKQFLYWATVLTHETIDRRMPVIGEPGTYVSAPVMSEEYKEAFRNMVKKADANIGVVIDKIRERQQTRDRKRSSLVWILSDNASFDTGKERGTERGARIVSIVWSPSGLVKPRGMVNVLMDVADVLPTVLDAVNATYLPGPPAKSDRVRAYRDYRGRLDNDAADGESLWPYLTGTPTAPEKDFALSFVAGFSVIRTRDFLYETGSFLFPDLQGANFARLYDAPDRYGKRYRRCERTAASPRKILGDLQSRCIEGRAVVESLRRKLGPVLVPDHPGLAASSEFLNRHRRLAHYYLYDHAAYRGIHKTLDQSLALRPDDAVPATDAATDARTILFPPPPDVGGGVLRHHRRGVVATTTTTTTTTTTPLPPLMVNTPRTCGLHHRTNKTVRPLFGNRTVFLMRFRKAASTTLCTVLVNYVKLRLLEEMRPLNLLCLPAISRPEVISLAHIRHPVDRGRSEYWYSGPGKVTGRDGVDLWTAWLDNGGSPHCRFNAGVGASNYFARRFLGRCGRCGTVHDLRPDDGDPHELVAYGCPAETDVTQCAENRHLDSTDASRALRALRSFDVVYVVEMPDASVRAIVHALDLPPADAIRVSTHLLTSHKNINKRTLTNSTFPPGIYDRLIHDNYLDLLLFHAAVQDLRPFAAQQDSSGLAMGSIPPRSPSSRRRRRQQQQQHSQSFISSPR